MCVALQTNVLLLMLLQSQNLATSLSQGVWFGSSIIIMGFGKSYLRPLAPNLVPIITCCTRFTFSK